MGGRARHVDVCLKPVFIIRVDYGWRRLMCRTNCGIFASPILMRSHSGSARAQRAEHSPYVCNRPDLEGQLASVHGEITDDAGNRRQKDTQIIARPKPGLARHPRLLNARPMSSERQR